MDLDDFARLKLGSRIIIGNIFGIFKDNPLSILFQYVKKGE